MAALPGVHAIGFVLVQRRPRQLFDDETLSEQDVVAVADEATWA